MKFLLILLIGLLFTFATKAEQVSHFQTGKAVPTALLIKELQNTYDSQIKDKNVNSVNVEGHTDQRGGFSYNQKLSEKRADAAMSELVKMGVPKEKITAVGKGKTKLLTTQTGELEYAKNRRVVITINTDKGSNVIVISEAKCEPKETVREVIKEVKADPPKNRISLMVGRGAKEGLTTSSSSTRVDIESNVGVIFGLQYQRLITEKVSLGITGLTSKAGLIGIGYDFP